MIKKLFHKLIATHGGNVILLDLYLILVIGVIISWFMTGGRDRPLTTLFVVGIGLILFFNARRHHV